MVDDLEPDGFGIAPPGVFISLKSKSAELIFCAAFSPDVPL